MVIGEKEGLLVIQRMGLFKTLCLLFKPQRYAVFLCGAPRPCVFLTAGPVPNSFRKGAERHRGKAACGLSGGVAYTACCLHSEAAILFSAVLCAHWGFTNILGRGDTQRGHKVFAVKRILCVPPRPLRFKTCGRTHISEQSRMGGKKARALSWKWPLFR